MYSILYWQGGAERGEWRCADSELSQKAAVAKVAEIERAGRPAFWMAPGRLEANGMPTGAPFWWDFATLRPKAVKPDVAAAVAHARALRS